MRKVQLAVLGLVGLFLTAPAAMAQQGRPYIGFAYPAGGQQGTTFQVLLGGQGMDDVDRIQVSGGGVTAKVIEYRRRLGPQEIQLLSEQLRELRKAPKGPKDVMMAPMMMDTPGAGKPVAGGGSPTQQLIEKIQKRISTYVQRPACSSISNLATIEVAVARDAKPGRRELTIATPRGVSNPLVFHVGQLPEYTRTPMSTAHFQVLGKEELALRKRPDEEIEQRVKLPCVVNGQIASGEVNRYRFEARKGQKLVISAEARELIPFVADAVPGWFQPVMTLYNAQGKEVAYADDYRFKPDPVILYEVPRDGEYVLNIIDAIYRGREDFVYRVSIGELPFVTSIFPLGGRAGAAAASVEMKGWNLQGAKLMVPAADAQPGIHTIVANKGGIISNRLDFQLDPLPEILAKEPNDDPARAQSVKLPVMVNGRIDKSDDWDVFQFSGKAGDVVVAEVSARRLESPLDSMLKVTDSAGRVLASNDDHEDAEAGENTHDADSYLMVKLPSDGTYFVHVGDTARHGGEEYAYRLRISAPQPDFALRIVPTSLSMRSRQSASVTVFAIRKDGFNLPIKLGLRNPAAGFSATPVTINPNQANARLNIKTDVMDTKQPVVLNIEGRATVGKSVIAHDAAPCEDRMQAFLWRHLVPADELKVLVFNPAAEPPAKRVAKVYPTAETKPVLAAGDKPKFTKAQVNGRLRQLKLLFEEGLLTDDFHHEKVMECEAVR